MNAELIVLIPILVAPIVLLFAFAGCGTILTLEESPEQEVPPKRTNVDIKRYSEAVGTVASGVTCHWALDEPDIVTQALDSVLPPNHGRYFDGHNKRPGVLDFIKLAGQEDSAAYFDGLKSYVQVANNDANSAAINPPLDFSVEAWIKPDGNPGGRQVVVGSYRPAATGKLARGWALEIQPGSPTKARCRIAYKPDSTLPATTEAELVTDLADSYHDWFHLVMTYRGADKRLSLFVNTQGASPLKPRVEFQLPGPNPSFVANANTAAVGEVVTNFRIGAGFIEPFSPTTLGGAFFFKGQIGHIAMYNKAIDPFGVRLHFVLATDPNWP